jgi:hypothetical protein
VKEEKNEKVVGSRWSLGSKTPPIFNKTKVPWLLDLSLELFYFDSIQLLVSNVDEVKELLYIDDSIDPLVIDDHFMNALVHLFSSLVTNTEI